jgi:Flp pilus assembly secretin CpaC
MKHTSSLFISIILAGMVFSFAAFAQTPSQPTADLMPPATTSAAVQPLPPLDGETHPPLNVSPDKSELVRLEKEASSVIVGNPSHITVLLDSPRLAVVIPRASGATYFTVLDKDGNVIMQRHVVVGAAKKNYVRVRRSCANSPDDANCQATSVYFCPDMCHEIGSGNGEEGGGSDTSVPTTATE